MFYGLAVTAAMLAGGNLHDASRTPDASPLESLASMPLEQAGQHAPLTHQLVQYYWYSRPAYRYGVYGYYSPGYSTYYSPGYGYYPPVAPYSYYGGYGGYWGHGGYYVLPPVTIPGETLYGPRAVRRFMGVW